MEAVTFASKLRDDGSVAIPQEAVDELGLHPGDELTVRVEPANGTDAIDEQAALQARFDRFFENLDTLTCEKPTRLPSDDPAAAAFSQAMDEKYHRLGFKP